MNEKEITYEPIEQEMKIVKEEALANYTTEHKYSYDDVQYWLTDNRRWELIDGIPLLMASPSINHQLISKDLMFLFEIYLRGKSCQIIPPVDTVLSYNEGSDTYVIPDLIIQCDRKKIKKGRIFGVPDLIIEILSSSTSSRDKITKRHKYEKAGVKEFWIVNPKDKSIEVSVLNIKGIFTSRIYKIREIIKVSIFKDLTINVADVFANPWLR